MDQFSIEIVSVADREQLVAEIWYGTSMIAEVSRETGVLQLELYSPGRFICNLEDFMDVVADAQRKLTGQTSG